MIVEKAQGWGMLVRPFRVTQVFIFQTAAFGSIFGEKQSTTSADIFMTITNSRLSDNENKCTTQDPGVTLLKLDASEQACSHSRLEAR